ncbi:hypothetical protein BT96DRAFT_993885 [Gymnopus androsaceus JB14]|uniref:C2H2-type domain-containing protein n=1 Tax=Gymnopus androsaceus JB14 TaxID=1447944 RepID=A0A6A4HN99_9AGAR|nr:hypothetical protein BT96DRAFT_993885 [Gymnopus androsaceus JB14]
MFSSPETTISNLYQGQCEPVGIPCKPSIVRSGSESFYEDIAQLVCSSVSPANSPDTVDDDLSSPGLSPTNPSPIYYYVDRVGSSFGSPSSPTEMYDTDPPSAYPASSSNNIYQQPLPTPQNTYSFATVSDIRESDEPASYPSDSPSPGDVHSSADFSHSYPESHSQHPHISSYQTDAGSRYNPSTQPTFSRDSYVETSSASALPSSLLDQRRMSEPAILAVPNAYSTTSGADNSRYSYPMAYSNSSRSSYAPSLQRGASIGSLRDLRHQHQQLHYSSSRSHTGWKTEEDSHHMAHGTHAGEGLESPLSPFQPSFPGSVSAGDSPTMAQGIQYSPIAEDYRTSPPGTSNSPSSLSRPSAQGPTISTGDAPGEDADADGNRSPLDPNSKTYSFVALPGNTVKKRPRRRYDEIERLYQCSWPDCNKAYGTLNHLNAHVTMQKHGSKRSPNEFKELRKQWRKAKKDSEAATYGGVSRRPSHYLGQDHDLHDSHSSRYTSHQRYNYPGGMSLPGMSTHSRYGMGTDDVNFTAAERNERSGLPFGARPRYDTTPTSQWNANISSSTRSSISSSPYLSSSLPSQSPMQHFHPGHGHSHSHSLHQLHFDTSSYHSSPTEPSDRPLTIPSPPQMHTGRLPPDSMLLTPLPGYEPRETLPPLQVGSDMTYDPEAYYEGNSGRRSGSGHASMGRGSGDNY